MSPIFKRELLFPPTQKLLAHTLNLLQQRKNAKEIFQIYKNLIFYCHSEQPLQTTYVSSALELTLLTSEVIFVTIFGTYLQNFIIQYIIVGKNLGARVLATTRSASKFRAGNNVITLQSVSSCSGAFTLESKTSAIYQLHKICVCVLLHCKFHTDFFLYCYMQMLQRGMKNLT
ncbi:Hypothetical_protein [Hexamita inflata]|uniref:Hypothetical_protein n=1 Tax=Hexamita inflata TaxID=28002 RepID=A0AA86Q7U8_9EUKA|nr:Hypothetical protein HINF_LOCUS35080 [Hexamita inflata]